MVCNYLWTDELLTMVVVERVESIDAIGAVFKMVFLGFRVNLRGHVLQEAVVTRAEIIRLNDYFFRVKRLFLYIIL